MKPAWLKLLPTNLRARIEHRANLQRVLTNTGWLFGDRILRLGLGLLVIIWMARYLGPEQFGTLNYAMAIVALFGTVASLGLNAIAVRDLVRAPEASDATLGTAFFLQVIGGLLALALAIATIRLARPADELARLMVSVLGLVLLLKATEVVKYWFESRVESKYVVWIENTVFVTVAAAKIGLVIAQAPLMAFVWAAFAEGLLAAVGLLTLYARRVGSLRSWGFRLGRAKALLADSWPLILSGLAVMIYMRIDQVMLGQMLDDGAVGIYTAAVRISEASYFVPMAIVASVFPSIIEAKQHSEALYYRRLQRLFDLMVWLALAVAIPMTLLSDWLVVLLFGEGYAPAAPVLSVHVWAGVFAYLGVASGKWFLVENLSRLLFYRTAIGAAVNVLLNLVLIPVGGVLGAAFATLASYAAAGFLSDLLDKRSRRVFFMKVNAILLRSVYARGK